jgi:PAS domain S-box-containing protein
MSRAQASANGGQPDARPRYAAVATWSVRVAGTTAVLIGGVHFALWLAGVVPRWSAQGVITMKTNMALAQVLAGVALLSLGAGRVAPRRRAVAVIASALVLVTGAATLSEHLFGVDLGIDQLFATEPPGAPGTASPNRMGLPGSLTLTLLAAGLLARGCSLRGSVLLGVAACCVVLVPAVGILYGADLYEQTQLAIAWPTMIALVLLGLGLSLAAQPYGGKVPLVWRDDPGGVLLRLMLAPAVLLPIGINFIRLEGERRGVYGRPVGAGLYAATIVVGFLIVLWRSAVRLSGAAEERDRAEQRARWRARLLDLAHDAIFIWSPQHGIESWNRGAEELYGFTVSEAVGRTARELLQTVFPRPWPAIEAELDRMARWEGELLHRAKTGEPLTVSAKLQVVRGADGAIRVFETVRDVTEIRRAADQLAAEKARLAVTLGSIGDAVIATDAARRVTVFNSVAEQLTGWRADEALNRPVDDVFRIINEETRRREESPVERVLREGVVVGLANHTVVIARDGTERPIADSAAPIRDDGGAVLGVVIVFRDQTEERRAESAQRESAMALRRANDQLREADRRKDEFLAVLSHELRNPLAPIRNSLYILDHARDSSEQGRRAKEVAKRQVAHLTRLVDDLLDVTRIARGKIQLQCRDVDLAALARRTGEDHRPLLQERGLELDVHAPTDPVLVNGDETRLAQVLGNLLQNAAKFTPAGGRVTVTVTIEARAAVVHVRDTGAGIEPGLMEAIFEPFTQANQTLARTEGGLGLGLAHVKGLIALHGGEVAAASDGPGRGADFTVKLPLLSRPAAPASEPVGAQQTSPRRRRVLVIDDNKDAAETMAELVEMFGHDAEIALDGPTAIAKARANPPNVVLCDIGLPGMDGYAVARALRAMRPQMRIQLVAVSGYALAEDLAKAREAGFDVHVAKPPDPSTIESILASGAA